jgi:hypothetical protein
MHPRSGELKGRLRAAPVEVRDERTVSEQVGIEIFNHVFTL